MINTIVLDLGNVLAKFQWEEFLRDYGFEQELIHKVGNATVHTEYWKELDRGVQAVDELMAQCIKQEPGLEKEIRILFDNLLQLVKEYDYSADFVKSLKENGYQVYLLSNFGKHYQLSIPGFSFLKYIDGGIISYQVQHVKPEPEIYEALINKYNINPAEAVFLDDMQENLEGAKPFGFHTIQVKSHEQAVEELKSLGVNL